MGASVTSHELAEELEAQLTALLTATKASRVTLRLDLPKYAFHVDDVAAEARKPGVTSLKGQTSIDQRRAPTVIWLDRERRLLVQPDLLLADPAPPPALIQVYGTTAQMLAPLVIDNALVGWISVHHNGGAREWKHDEIATLSALADAFIDRLKKL